MIRREKLSLGEAHSPLWNVTAQEQAFQGILDYDRFIQIGIIRKRVGIEIK